jgi:hypothetical protein
MARADEELKALHKDLDRTLELQNKLADKASTLEREKRHIEAALQKRVEEFEAERVLLRARIEDMSEDVRVKAEATAQAELLKVGGPGGMRGGVLGGLRKRGGLGCCRGALSVVIREQKGS